MYEDQKTTRYFIDCMLAFIYSKSYETLKYGDNVSLKMLDPYKYCQNVLIVKFRMGIGSMLYCNILDTLIGISMRQCHVFIILKQRLNY